MKILRSSLAFCLMQIPLILHAAPPWGAPYGQPGIASMTCTARTSYPAASAYVFGMMDLNGPPAAFYGPSGASSPMWIPPMHHEPSWTAENLGNIYGTEYDDAGNVYVGANGLYNASSSFYWGYGALGGGVNSLSAAGTIYKIDATTGAPSVFAVLPQQSMSLASSWNSGPGIGNLTFHKGFNKFFATNLEDGKIYPISNTGAVGSPFDPMGTDDSTAGMPPASERLWGIEVLGNQIYYAVWNTGPSTTASVRRVDLDSSGNIIPSTDVAVLPIPASPPMVWIENFVVVADIEFSADGQTMILGQRGIGNWGSGNLGGANHAAKVYIAQLSGTTWSITNTLETGDSWGVGETYGGVAFGAENGAEEALVWMSSADLAGGAGPHGLQGTRRTDFPVASATVSNSFRVPYDPSHTPGDYSFDWKGVGGDVDVFPNSACAEFAIERVLCPEEIGDPYCVTVNITNRSTNTAVYARYSLCPAADLPAGGISAKPSPAVQTLPNPIVVGATEPLTWKFPTVPLTGGKVYFLVTLLDETGEECCTEKICVDLPRCDCAEILDQVVKCDPLPSGVNKYTITLTVRNRSHLSGAPFDFANATVLPPAGFGDPDDIVINPDPIAPGAIGTIELCYTGSPGMICFTLSLHDELFEDCCAVPNIWIELPPCDGGTGDPDTCELEARVPCCPDATGVPSATINFTVCNNSSVPRTYTWFADGFLHPDCPITLTPGHFSQSTGTLGPIAPGNCATVTLQIRCDGIEPGRCAKYRVCAFADPDAAPLCCEGEVYGPLDIDPTVKFEPGETPVVGVGEEVDAAVRISNQSDRPIDRSVSIFSPASVLYLVSPDGERSLEQQVRVVLSPGESMVVAVGLGRWDDGRNAPDHVQLHVSNDRNSAPLLAVPVRLSEKDSGRGARRLALRVEEVTPEDATLLVSHTEIGKRYRMQQSPDLSDWADTDCAVIEGGSNPDGTFNGTGGSIHCVVPCPSIEERVFFRLLEVETP
ncbi:MAG: hypothetical protein ACI8XO_004628 [Verrucomicrobiales bacterium]|jgi:hypothetical protein